MQAVPKPWRDIRTDWLFLLSISMVYPSLNDNLESVKLLAERSGIAVLTAIFFIVMLPRPVIAMQRGNTVLCPLIRPDVVGRVVILLYRIDGLSISSIAILVVVDVVTGYIREPVTAFNMNPIFDLALADFNGYIGDGVAGQTGIVI